MLKEKSQFLVQQSPSEDMYDSTFDETFDAFGRNSTWFH